MKCREVRRFLDLYRESELPDETLRQIQQHAGACQRCAQELQQSRHAEKTVAGLRRGEPRLHDQRDLTDQIMRRIESIRMQNGTLRMTAVQFPPRRVQIVCTLAAAAIVAAFFIQNVRDVSRMAAMETRLDQLPSRRVAASGEPPLAAAGLSAIAEIGSFLSQPPSTDSISLHGRLRFREAVHSFFGMLEEGSPAVTGEVERLRAKYPDLWLISPRDGITDNDRMVLGHQGKALMKDLHTLLQPGKSNNEE